MGTSQHCGGELDDGVVLGIRLFVEQPIAPQRQQALLFIECGAGGCGGGMEAPDGVAPTIYGNWTETRASLACNAVCQDERVR